MVKAIHRALFATGLVAALAVTVHGCAIIGTIDFGITFRPTGAPRAIDCQQAAVATVKFEFFDQALDGLLRTSVARPCVPNERYRVSIDLGPYAIRVQGLNGVQTICYETTTQVTVQGGKTEVLNLEAQQHPNGAAGGCVYPTVQP
jgi:hypothetical protein